MTVIRHGSHLLRQRFNLSSGTTRSATAKLLKEASRADAIDWRECLEMTCLAVLDLHRQGEPFDIVGHRPLTTTVERRLIDPYIPLNRASLFWAPGGAGKSTLARAIVVSVELFAEVIPGWHPRSETRCLVLDWEGDAAEWNDGLSRIAAGIGAEMRSVMYRRCRHPLDEQVEKLAEVIDRNNIGLLVVDSAEKAVGAGGGGETYEGRAQRLYDALDRLAVTAIVIDHVAGDDVRNGDSRVIRKAIGSTMKVNWARAAYDLKREVSPLPGRVELVMHSAKINDGPRLPPYEFAIVYDGDNGPIRFERSATEAPELLRSLSQPEQMARALAAGAKSTRDVAAALDVPESSVRTILTRDRGRRFVRLPDNSIGLVMRHV